MGTPFKILLFALSAQSPRLASPPSGHFYTGNDLARDCRAFIRTQDGTPQGSSADATLDIISSSHCVAYLYDTADAFSFVQQAGIATPKSTTVCVPSSVTGARLARIFLKYLDAHPEMLDLTASMSVWDSLNQAFPCH